VALARKVAGVCSQVNNAWFGPAGRFLDNDLGSELAGLHVNSRANLILNQRAGFGNKVRCVW